MNLVELLHFTEHRLQEMALAFMAMVYIIKVFWILKFKPTKERTTPRGSHGRGIGYSFSTLAMPWAMESTAKHPMKYVEFAFFHIAVAIVITVTFLIPYAPRALGAHPLIVPLLQVMVGIGLAMGIIRFFRRLFKPEMRIISSPDDFFSLFILNVYLFLALIAFPAGAIGGLEGLTQVQMIQLLLYFGMTTFFLIYVPFSKISHYLLWPFLRFYLGKHWGHRGVYPKTASSR